MIVSGIATPSEASSGATSASEKLRLKAVVCEKLAAVAGDPAIRLAWSEIAIEWHALAFQAAALQSEVDLEAS
jgi:hypothetical protein